MYTETDIENANRVLEFLVEHADKNIESVMAENLEKSEFDLNKENMAKNLETANREEAFGAIAQGTGVVKDEVGLDGEPGQRAVKLLKERFRIQQCGRGRGRVLIILDPTPVEAQVEEQETTDEPVKVEEMGVYQQETEDFDELLDKIRSHHHTAVDALADRDQTIAELTARVEEMSTKIDELSENLEVANTATWS